jgi:hypothetical protein
MHHFFSLFLARMKSSFRSIARATGHEVEESDLQSDAWIVAHEISKRRGRDIDFSDPADQELVIRAVNLQNVRRGDWHMRKSVRIDQEAEHEDSTATWSERLPAAETSDPLFSLLLRESALDAEIRLAASYSQATAYVRVFGRFKYDSKAVCNHLAISNDTLARRVKAAATCVRVQPSLFDGRERIEKRFRPAPGCRIAELRLAHIETKQQAWDF